MTTVVIVLGPATSGIAPLAVPDVTEVPLTLTVAAASVTVGVTLNDVVVLDTLAV